jgi:colanic acid biosynthesis glycosyl transferase WcaI
MKILIVSDVYPPEISSAGHLMKELAEGLNKKGHQITVATSYPRSYLDSQEESKKLALSSVEDGINVIRIKTLPLRKVNFILRGISQLFLPFLFLNKIKEQVKGNIDVTIIYSPPILLGLMAKRIKKLYNSKVILNVQDIFPQNAIDLGILKNKILIKLFEKIEKTAYKNADIITFNSDGGRKFLIEKKGLSPEKVITFYNWIDPKPYQNLEKKISFREEYNLQEKFIFLFAGVMGPAQELDFLIKVAKEVSDIKDVVFLLVGDGMEKEKLEKMIKEYSLSNVVIKPFISKDNYPYLLKDVDVGMVCLSIKNKTPFIPGKFLGYLAAGKPIVAFLNKESDGFPLIEKASCGYAVISDDEKKAAEMIRKIYKEKNNLENFSKSGKEYTQNNLTIDVSIKKFEELFEKLIRKNSS